LGWSGLAGARVVVTGGAGFLGSHLCEALLDAGASVVCIDNFVTGAEHNIAHLRDRDLELVVHDVSTHVTVDGDVDAVLHLASPASPVDYLELPIQTLKVGALGTHNLLGLAKDKGARFLLASTSEVYGDPLVHPQPETYWGNVNPVGPRGVYDEAKRFAEAMSFAYHRTHDVDIRIARIFNTFGPRMRLEDGRAVPTFVTQAMRDEPLTVHGDGSQTRSLCYVDDMTDGLMRLLRSDLVGPVNLGGPHETSIRKLAEQVMAASGGRPGIVSAPRPEDDPQVRQPDITLARQRLGWEPRVSVEEGLRRTVAWYRDAGPAASGRG
jgi:dTDP-glucose 4,6-dehydratase